MINLSRTKNVLRECLELIKQLDGVDLDERDAVSGTNQSNARKVRAQRSQDLQMLATRLELAAHLVRVEYYYARGKGDPLHGDRHD